MTFPTEAETRKFLAKMRIDLGHFRSMPQRESNVVVVPTTHGHWVITGAEEAQRPAKICSICYQPFPEFGNNAQPVNDGDCCSYCDDNVVIPARMARAKFTP